MKKYPGRRVVISVRRKEGQWEPLKGGKMPKFEEGAIADLIVDADSFIETEEVSRFEIWETPDLLPANSTLYACMTLNDGDIPKVAEKGTKEFPFLGHPHFFIRIELNEALRLRFRGSKKPELCKCSCVVPCLGEIEIRTVNEAYSRISEKYEPWRRSHTGNVFKKIYYQPEREKYVRPLNDLRNQEEYSFSH